MDTISKGSIFVLTNGAYADYELVGVFEALEDIDKRKLHNEYLKAHPEQEMYLDAGCFKDWLENDKAKAIRTIEVNIWGSALSVFGEC